MDYENGLERLSLRWNNYNDNMKTGFHDLLTREDFVDVTIAAEGKLIQAHKMVLSISSPYFKNLFKANPCQHPIVFLKDVTHKEISAILQFMYMGEVSVEQEELGRFLKTAKALQIKGLTLTEDRDASQENTMERKVHSVRSEEVNKNKTKVLKTESGDSFEGRRINMQLGSSVKVNAELSVTESPNSQQWNSQVSNGIIKTEVPDPEYDDSECDSFYVNGHNGSRVNGQQDEISEQSDDGVTISEKVNHPGMGHDLSNKFEMNDLYRPMEACQGLGQDLNSKTGSNVIYKLGEGCQEIRFLMSKRRCLYLLFNNYLYIKDHVGVASPGQQKTIYWKCKDLMCRARVIQKDFKFRLKRKTFHQHLPNATNSYPVVPIPLAYEMLKQMT